MPPRRGYRRAPYGSRAPSRTSGRLVARQLGTGPGCTESREPRVKSTADRVQVKDAEPKSLDETKVTNEIHERIMESTSEAKTAAGMSIMPNELLTMIYEKLDVVDAVCLSLTSKRQYMAYVDFVTADATGKTPKVKLNARRFGQAGTIERSWEVVAKDECAHCGQFRCQLYRHISTWMEPLVSTNNFFDYRCRNSSFTLGMSLPGSAPM